MNINRAATAMIVVYSSRVGDRRRSSADRFSISATVRHLHLLASAIVVIALAAVTDGALACADYGAVAPPELVGSIDTPGLALGIAVSGNLAFVADHGHGLRIFDIENPADPQSIGAAYTASSAARGVEALGDYVLVADESAGLLIFDVADPAEPILLGSVDTPGNAYALSASGSLVFVADYIGGVVVAEISNPTAPQLVGSVAVPGFTYDVEVSGSLLLIASSGGLRVADISSPTEPDVIGEIATTGDAYSVSTVGTVACVAVGSAGLDIVDIANPASPQVLGNIDSPQHAHAVAVSNNFAYVADELPGLWVVDIANPWQPQYVGRTATPSAARSIALHGDNVFVATEATGFQAAPRQCGDIAQFALAIADVPSDQGGNLRVSWPRHRAENPVSSLSVSRYQLQRLGQQWQPIAELAAADTDSYTTVVNTPYTLTIGIATPRTHFRVLACADTTSVYYVSAPDSAFAVDNLAPHAPLLTLTDTETSRTLVWFNDGAPDLAETCLYRDFMPGFEAGEPVACSSSQFWYLETHLARYYYRARSFDVHGNAGEWSNEVIGRWPTPVPGAMPTVLRLYPCQPNPFNPRTTIRYDLPEAGPVRLSVFDLAGRRVRTLVDESMPQGSHEAVWDGRDASGREVSSGTYLARLEFGGKVEVVRMGLVR